MYDRSRLTRLITLALVSCCATWGLAATAMAGPDISTESAAPAYKPVAGDTNKAPGATASPAFKPVAGDTDKAPGATAAPAFKPVAGDSVKTPDARQVQGVLDGIGRGKTPGQPAVVDATNDDTGTIALIVAIVAMLTALAAMTMIALRQARPVMRA